jgi:hypothetical protein
LVPLGDWEVIGLSRRQPDFKTPAGYLAMDLLNRADVDRVRTRDDGENLTKPPNWKQGFLFFHVRDNGAFDIDGHQPHK